MKLLGMKPFILKHAQTKACPELMIFEINLRSFSPEWHMRPEYQFEREKMILNGRLTRGINSILSAFNYQYHKYSEHDFFRTPVYFDRQKVGTVKDFVESDNFQQYGDDTKIQKKCIFYYLYRLTEQHPKIQAMKNLIVLCSQSNVDVLFFITPIDYLYGEQYVPGQFDAITARNIDIITSTLEREDIAYLDLSKSLESSFFSHGMYADEHLQQQGRNFVAKSLSDSINNRHYR